MAKNAKGIATNDRGALLSLLFPVILAPNADAEDLLQTAPVRIF